MSDEPVRSSEADAVPPRMGVQRCPRFGTGLRFGWSPGTQAAKTKHCNGAPSIGGWSQSGLYAPGLPGRVVVSMAARLPNTRRSAFNYSFSFKWRVTGHLEIG